MAGADRSKPRDGRCNAETAGGFCHGMPVRGGSRCRLHGGERQQFAQRLRRLDEEAQQQVHDALTDPDLLDVRRPLAIAEVVIAQTPLLPTEATLERVARRKILRDIGPDVVRLMRHAVNDADEDDDLREVLHAALDELLRPSEADLDEAALDMHERSMRLLAMFSKRQVEAVKQLEWAKAIRDQILPFLGELSIQLTQVLRRHVPDEKYEAALTEMRTAITRTLGALSVAAEDGKRR